MISVRRERELSQSENHRRVPLSRRVGCFAVIVDVAVAIVPAVLFTVSAALLLLVMLGLASPWWLMVFGGTCLIGLRWQRLLQYVQRNVVASGPRSEFLEVVEIRGITQCWSIDGLEDFGPGYLLRTIDNEYAIVIGGYPLGAASEEFLTAQGYVGDDVWDPGLSTEMLARRWSETLYLHAIELRGEFIPAMRQEIHITQLDRNFEAGLRTLELDEFSAEVQQLIRDDP